MKRLLTLALLAGCAPRSGGEPLRVERIEAGGARVQLVYAGRDQASARRVAEALPEAAARAARFASLRRGVTITLHPTQEALAAAAGRPGQVWLRAWARFASVELLAPEAWSLLGPGRDEVVALLAHELAHCAMYQTAGADRLPAAADPPLWFREGLASVSAGEEAKRPGPEALARFYGRAGWEGRGPPPPGDPLSDPSRLLAAEPDLVYGAAHHAFLFLLRRYGEQRIRAVLAGMAAGRPFGEAFREVTGIEVAAFEADFRRSLVWGGPGYSARRTTEAMAQSRSP